MNEGEERRGGERMTRGGEEGGKYEGTHNKKQEQGVNLFFVFCSSDGR